MTSQSLSAAFPRYNLVLTLGLTHKQMQHCKKGRSGIPKSGNKVLPPHSQHVLPFPLWSATPPCPTNFSSLPFSASISGLGEICLPVLLTLLLLPHSIWECEKQMHGELGSAGDISTSGWVCLSLFLLLLLHWQGKAKILDMEGESTHHCYVLCSLAGAGKGQ